MNKSGFACLKGGFCPAHPEDAIRRDIVARAGREFGQGDDSQPLVVKGIDWIPLQEVEYALRGSMVGGGVWIIESSA